MYAAAGLTALTRHDLRFNDQHPPLAKALAALPALAAHPVIPAGAAWAHPSEKAYTTAFVRAQIAAGKLRRVTFLSRLVPLALLLASAPVLSALAGRLAGPTGGLLAAGLWLADPFVLGLGHLDGIDLPFTLATLLVALGLLRWLERRDTRRLVVLGLACGAALLTRHTGPLVASCAVLSVAVAARAIRPPAVVAAVTYLTLWAGYLLFDPAHTLRHPNVLPARYLSGLRHLYAISSHPSSAFLLGRHWVGGWLPFWPASMLVKLPVTLLIALVTGPLLWRRVAASPRRQVLASIAPPAGVLAGFTLGSQKDIGLRYLLPVLALATVAVAPLVQLRWPLPALLLAGSVGFTAWSLPHSLAWTAPPFRPGYRVASDSNLDWGQDLYRLQAWAKGRHPTVAYFGPYGVTTAAIPGARRLAKAEPLPAVHGDIAISATLLNSFQDNPALRHQRPIGTLGGSVLLYRLP